MAPSRPPKILIVTTVHWPATTRLGLALAKCGFSVGAVAPARHGLRQLGCLAAGFVCHAHFGVPNAVAWAIEQWAPDLLVAADDRALFALHRLHAQAVQGRGGAQHRIRELIERSLGDPRHFALIERKSELTALAKAEGLSVPDTTIVRGLGQLRRHLARATCPQVLKTDGSWGGLGVRIVRSVAEAEQAFADLGSPASWPRIGKQVLQDLNFAPLGERLRGRRPTVTVQDYVPGRPANRAVACWQGEVLAGLSVEVVQCDGATGPASVVRAADHPEMADATARLVRRLGMSGFCGVDFILDAAGRAHFIEINARTTTICYLARDAQSDMIGALYAQLTHTARREVEPARHDVVAFFPHELWRDPKSKFLVEAYHDVPWEEPQLVAAYLKPDRPGWVDRLHRMVRSARPLGTPAPSLHDTAVDDAALDDLDVEPLKPEG